MNLSPDCTQYNYITQISLVSILLHDIPRYDQPLNLASSFINFCYSCISIIPLTRHVSYVAHSSKNLNRLMSYIGGSLAASKFGHGCLLGVRFTSILESGCLVHHQL